MKKVIYDLSFVGDGRVTGIERFSIEIAKKLQSNNDLDITVAMPKGCLIENSNVRFLELPFKNKLLCHIFLSMYVFWYGYNIAIFPAFPPSLLQYVLSYFKRCDVIRVIHDVVFLKNPETLPIKSKIYLKPLELLWLRKYVKIVTVSEYSKLEICRELKVGDVHVCYNGVSSDFLEVAARESPKIDYCIMCVGTIEPRKNYDFLVKVFSKLKEKYPNIKLKIYGRYGWGCDYFVEKVKAIKDVQLLMGVTDQQLRLAYKEADIFVYPSLHEGFGIPIVEAMACSLPVVAANNSAIAEVVGDFGILVSGYDVDEWSASIEAVLTNSESYNYYSNLSKIRSNHFTWAESAKSLQEIIK